jgi:hypothetical protein
VAEKTVCVAGDQSLPLNSASQGPVCHLGGNQLHQTLPCRWGHQLVLSRTDVELLFMSDLPLPASPSAGFWNTSILSCSPCNAPCSPKTPHSESSKIIVWSRICRRCQLSIPLGRRKNRRAGYTAHHRASRGRACSRPGTNTCCELDSGQKTKAQEPSVKVDGRSAEPLRSFPLVSTALG